MTDPLAVEGWLYLARPALASLVVLFAIAAWLWDREESHPSPRRPDFSRWKRARPSTAGPPGAAWWLEVLQPGPTRSLRAGQQIAVADRLSLGRAPQCAVVLEDPAVSGLHAQLVTEGDACRVEDLGSRNGTLLDGELLHGSRDAADGQILQIGEVVLRVRRCRP